MSVPNIEAFNKYKGNGLATEFSVSFPYNSKNDIHVYLKRKDALYQETLQEGVDYEFVNNSTIKFPCVLEREVEKDGQVIIEEYTNQNILEEGDILAIYRETPLESNYNFKNQVRLFPADVTNSDDLSIMLIQELYAMIQRALIMDQTSDITPAEIVDQVKEYVVLTQQYATSAANSAEEAANILSNVEQQIQELVQNIIPQIEETKNDAILNIDSYVETSVKPMIDSYGVQILDQTLENSTKPLIDNYIENEIKPDIYEYAQTEGIQPIEQATIEAIEKIKEEGGLGRFEVGDIGISPFVDEGKNLRRYLNGQVILQSQFAGFATKLKKAVETYPNLATTEDNWQAIKSNSKIGQCGKFVIDDTAGTIRLPRIVKLQGLLDLSNIGNIVDDGLPTLTTNSTGNHAHTRGTMNITGQFTSDLTDTVGAFYNLGGERNDYADGSGGKGYNIGFDASKTWTGNTSSNGAHSHTIAGTSDTVQEEAIQYPYFIQVANGYVEDVNIDMVASKLNNDFSNAVFPIKGDDIIVQSKNGYKLVFTAGDGDSFAGFVLYGPNADAPVYNNSFALFTKLNGTFNHAFRGFPDGRLEWDNRSIAAMGMPSNKYTDLTLGASDSLYTAPANGWFTLAKKAASVGQYLQMNHNSNGMRSRCDAAGSSSLLSVYMPVLKGQQVRVVYVATGNTETFRFIYAEGDNIGG